MEIVGTGFLAHHLRSIADHHEHAVVLAAGIPLPENTESAYDRETALVDRYIDRCRSDGRTLVFFSTAAAGLYGGLGCRGLEDVPPIAPNRSGRHKLALEARIRESDVDHLSLRLTYVVGPHGRDDRLIPALVRQISAGAVTVYRGARRDLLDVADFVAILDRLLAAGLSREVVNVASGDSAPVECIIDHIEHRLGTRARRTFIDVDMPHTVSVAKLHGLLPGLEALGFGADYHRTVIDRYLAADRSSPGGAKSEPLTTALDHDGSPPLSPA